MKEVTTLTLKEKTACVNAIRAFGEHSHVYPTEDNLDQFNAAYVWRCLEKLCEDVTGSFGTYNAAGDTYEMLRKHVTSALEKIKPVLRVRVAKDAIAQIKAHKLNMASGTYINGIKEVYEALGLSGEDFAKTPIEGALDTIQSHCEVCAYGALLLCQMRVCDGNKTFDDFLLYGAYPEYGFSSAKIKQEVKLLFGAKNAGLIEAAFESSTSYIENALRYRYDENEIEDAMCFGGGMNDEDNALHIFTNIVEHNGTFVPSDVPTIKE